MTLNFKVSGTEVSIDETALSEDTIANLVKQGIAIVLQRSTAGMDKESTAEEKSARILEVAKAIQENTYRFGAGGGGGARLSDDERFFRDGAVTMLVAKVGMKKGDAERFVVKEPEKNVIKAIADAANVPQKIVSEKLAAYIAKRKSELAELAI